MGSLQARAFLIVKFCPYIEYIHTTCKLFFSAAITAKHLGPPNACRFMAWKSLFKKLLSHFGVMGSEKQTQIEYSCIFIFKKDVVYLWSCMHAKLLQLCPDSAVLWTVTWQAPLFMEFSQQYCSGLPCPSPLLMANSPFSWMIKADIHCMSNRP